MAIGSERTGARGWRSSVREVCLLGMDRRTRLASFATGERVTWLGRGYRVVAAAPATDSAATRPMGGLNAKGCRRYPIRRDLPEAATRGYVHLAIEVEAKEPQTSVHARTG
jgi:hypothetical protein